MAKAPYRVFASSFATKNLKDLFRTRVSQTKATGRDGVRPDKFGEKLDGEIGLIRKKVLAGTYRFTPYRAKLVSKGPRKPPRVLSIPTVRDRLTLRAMCDFLGEVYAEGVTPKPHAYIRDIKGALPSFPGGVFLRVDVKEYYPSIDRDILIAKLRKKIRKKEIINLIASAISTETIDQSDTGIPQGLSISNILASIYLMEVDASISGKYKYFRYVDDILILCKDEVEAKSAYLDVQAHLAVHGLTCHDFDPSGTGKTCIRKISDGVDYLGFNLREKASVREASYRKMFDTILSVLTHNKYTTNHLKMLWHLNLKISGCIYDGKNYGWLFFFLQTDNVSQLKYLDMFIEKEFNRRGLAPLMSRVKRFVKVYHEIRYNQDATKYVPNFDLFDIEEMAETISLLSGAPVAGLKKMKPSHIKERFYKLIGREVYKLERDLLEFFS